MLGHVRLKDDSLCFTQLAAADRFEHILSFVTRDQSILHIPFHSNYGVSEHSLFSYCLKS